MEEKELSETQDKQNRIAIISIKVETDADEERILYYLKQFCVENFQKQAEICVTGRNKTLYFPEK